MFVRAITLIVTITVTITVTIGTLFSCGCQQSEMAHTEAELAMTRAELARTKVEFAELNTRLNSQLNTQLSNQHTNQRGEKRLVHLVWFKLKAGEGDSGVSNRQAMIGELNNLADIPQVQNLEIGSFCELGDKRAMSDLDLVMQMGFENESDYRTYQDHPIHLQLKSDIGQYLSGPPVTYDYWSE